MNTCAVSLGKSRKYTIHCSLFSVVGTGYLVTMKTASVMTGPHLAGIDARLSYLYTSSYWNGFKVLVCYDIS